MQNRDQFAFVVAALRERLRGGGYVQGEPLTVNELAATWGVSATPVREALARLAGEGLVEDRRGRGYFAWRLDVADLADLYEAQEALTLTALAKLVRRAPEAGPEPPGHAALAVIDPRPQSAACGAGDEPLFWEVLTWRVAREAGHRFFLGEQQRLADRLAPARRVEPAVLREGDDALNRLADQVNRRAWASLRVDLAPFFAVRRASVGAIINALRVDSGFYI